MEGKWFDLEDARAVMRESKEFSEGRAAFARDMEVINNPYRIHTIEAEYWDHGWWEAYESEGDLDV